MKNIGGEFHLQNGLIVPNTIVEAGALKFLQLLFQADDNLPASFYLGLTNADYTFLSASLADIHAGEPVGNGYARQELPRDSGWTLSTINGVCRVRSPVVTFTASAQWDKNWTRMFLCDASSGTTGTVYALSKETTPQATLSGQGPSMAYEFWMRGGS